MPVGTFGEILLLARAPGKVEARARYRDWDGMLREIQVTAKTGAAAERALKAKLAQRALFQPGATILTDLADRSPDALLFCSRNGTPLTPNNVRRQLRRVLDLAGLERVSPHKFRRTVATEIDKAADEKLAAELLGHTDTRITIKHYLSRDNAVDPATAAILDRALRPDS
jgi:integrase